MRIISGQYRGRRLDPVKLEFTRPTTDFAREGLFNMLHSRIDFEGLEVLDLYTGSGAVAMEFISRGVEHAVVVDNNYQSVKFISEIKEKWSVQNIEVIKNEALKYLDRCSVAYDIIFADPPYGSDEYEELLKIVFDKGLLKEDGYLILEHDKKREFSSHGNFDFQRAFGNVNFSIFSNSIKAD